MQVSNDFGLLAEVLRGPVKFFFVAVTYTEKKAAIYFGGVRILDLLNFPRRYYYHLTLGIDQFASTRGQITIKIQWLSSKQFLVL